MALPYFYISAFDPAQAELELDETHSKHIVQVLRMQSGEALQLTDGKGNLVTGVITAAHKKHCRIAVRDNVYVQPQKPSITIAISLLKNTGRFEFFLEKSTELGITALIPLICERTERQQFRQERMQSILVSALLQSQQTWLPDLHQPTAMPKLFPGFTQHQKFIAHCREGNKRSFAAVLNQSEGDQIILNGPEGDFTPFEIDSAIHHGYIPVTLGDTRLRTETAGMAAAVMMRLFNH